jgi:hypothetical protein
MIGQAIDVATSAITGKVATPGSVRTITGSEVCINRRVFTYRVVSDNYSIPCRTGCQFVN